MLIIAAFGLWVPLFLVGAMLFSGVNSYGAALGFGALVELALKAGVIAIAILLLYALLAKPWRRPGWERTLFFLQTPAVVVVCFGMAQALPYYLEDLQYEEQQTQFDTHLKNLIAALLSDDAARFPQLLTACGKDCKGPWLDNAVVYEAAQTAGVLLKNPESDYLTADYTGARSGCFNQTLYHIPLSRAGLVGLHNNPSMLAQFQPYWSRADIQQALHGAAAGNHVELMQALVEQGADLRERTDDPEASLVVAAIRGGAIDALNWLAQQGVRVHGEQDQLEAWHSVNMWIGNVSQQTSAQHIDALLDALQALGIDPAPKTPEGIQPLKESVLSLAPANGILAEALLHHGAHREFLDRDALHALQATLARPASTYAADDAMVQRICGKRGKGEAGRDWGWPTWTVGGMP